MKQPLRTLVICCCVVLGAAACAKSVAGNAEVGPVPVSTPSAAASSGPASSPAPSSAPISQPVLSSAPSSQAPASSIPESAPPESTDVVTTPESSSESSTSESSSTKTTPPTPTTSKSVSRKTTLNCPSGSLTAKGGAFCYQIPSGFDDTSSSATYPGSDPVRTAIQPTDSSGGARDLIFVTSTTLDINADTLSDALIKSSLEKALSPSSSGATNTPLVQSVVAGERAFETSIKFADGVKQRYLLVFAGHTRVSISCQYQNQQAQITSACASVLKSLQIKYP